MSRLSWAKIARREAVSEGGKKDPTVGRRDDLPWVAETTYSRFFSPPPRARMTSALERGRPRCHKMRILAHALLVV